MPDVSAVSTTSRAPAALPPTSASATPVKMGFWARLGNAADAALQVQATVLAHSGALAKAQLKEGVKEIDAVAAHVLQDQAAARAADNELAKAHKEVVRSALSLVTDTERSVKNSIEAAKDVLTP